MSATTELLLEQIKNTEVALKRSLLSGDESTTLVLKQKLQDLQNKFNASNDALNEGKGVLKG